MQLNWSPPSQEKDSNLRTDIKQYRAYVRFCFFFE